MSEVVTIRIDKRTKEKIRKHKINVSETVRTALRTEIQKREEKELGESLREAGEILRKIPEDDIVKAIRQSRDER
jgi:antitoxin CcdA